MALKFKQHFQIGEPLFDGIAKRLILVKIDSFSSRDEYFYISSVNMIMNNEMLYSYDNEELKSDRTWEQFID